MGRSSGAARGRVARARSLVRVLLGEGLAGARFLGPAGLAGLADLVGAVLGGDGDGAVLDRLGERVLALAVVPVVRARALVRDARAAGERREVVRRLELGRVLVEGARRDLVRVVVPLVVECVLGVGLEHLGDLRVDLDVVELGGRGRLRTRA